MQRRATSRSRCRRLLIRMTTVTCSNASSTLAHTPLAFLCISHLELLQNCSCRSVTLPPGRSVVHSWMGSSSHSHVPEAHVEDA